jgi:hypothetical protein
MSKILSVFERLNLIEKVSEEKEDNFKINAKDIEESTEAENITNNNSEIEFPEVNNEDNHSTAKGDNHSALKTELNYERNMNISDIYSAFGIENSNVNTVFMLGNFINALPENLPYEVKKRSVMNIISASNTDLVKLLSDGERRLNVLSQFASEYHNSTNNMIDQLKAEIIRLNGLINKYKEQIHMRETMLEEQNYTIKYEAEKISNIINFFNEIG